MSTMTKMYKCGICGKPFSEPSRALQHAKDAHGRQVVRSRFKDYEKAGTKPQLFKFRSREDPKERHRRRKAEAMATEFAFRSWCESNGVELTITNHGHHWSIRFPGDDYEKPRYQWWPSSAKCVREMGWGFGVHVHDIGQLAYLIARREGWEESE